MVGNNYVLIRFLLSGRIVALWSGRIVVEEGTRTMYISLEIFCSKAIFSGAKESVPISPLSVLQSYCSLWVNMKTSSYQMLEL